MGMKAEHGALGLAEISRFTAFVSAAGLGQEPQAIGALLEAVMHRLAPPLEIQEVEGDAVFALGADDALLRPAQLLDVLDSAFADFNETRRTLAADESCSCGACRSVERLDLKI